MKKSVFYRTLSLGVLLAAMTVSAGAQTVATNLWTGASGVDTNWSDANNWQSLAVPDSTMVAVFGNGGAGASPGATRTNYVDNNFVLSSLMYTNNAASPGNYQVTQILPTFMLVATNGFFTGGSNGQNVANAIITGAGAALAVSNGTFY